MRMGKVIINILRKEIFRNTDSMKHVRLFCAAFFSLLEFFSLAHEFYILPSISTIHLIFVTQIVNNKKKKQYLQFLGNIYFLIHILFDNRKFFSDLTKVLIINQLGMTVIPEFTYMNNVITRNNSS